MKYRRLPRVRGTGEKMSIAQTFQSLAEALVAPRRGLAVAADARSFGWPLVGATLAALALAVVVTPRLDFERGVDDALERAAQDAPAGEPVSPHDREVAVARAEKLGRIASYAAALLGPALRAVAAAVALFLAFALVGPAAPFRATLSVVAWGLLPLAVRQLLLLPAALAMRGATPEGVERALPSSLAALLPASAPPRLLSVGASLDLFACWALVLVALGMAHAAGTTRARACTVVAVLWASYVLLRHVALPGLAGTP
jgi:hypothetical protein